MGRVSKNPIVHISKSRELGAQTIGSPHDIHFPTWKSNCYVEVLYGYTIGSPHDTKFLPPKKKTYIGGQKETVTLW